MFFYQYIYKCTSAKICYKMEKNEIYDVYKINNIYAKKSTITIVQYIIGGFFCSATWKKLDF